MENREQKAKKKAIVKKKLTKDEKKRQAYNKLLAKLAKL